MATVSNPMTGAMSIVNEASGKAADFVSSRIVAANTAAKAAMAHFETMMSSLRAAAKDDLSLKSIGTPKISYVGSKIPTLMTDTVTWPVIDSSILSGITKPTLQPLEPLPSVGSLLTGANSLFSVICTRLNLLLASGATGLSAAVEQAIWDRARQRQELKNLAQYAEAENYFAARGFDLPTGALVSRLTQISVEIGRNDAALNTDIAIEQAKLEQTNVHFILEKGTAMVVDAINAALNAVIKANEVRLETFKQAVSQYIAALEGAIRLTELQIKEAESKVDLAKVRLMAAIADADAQAKSLAVQLEYAKAEAQIAIEKGKAMIDFNVRRFGIQVEAARGGAQAAAQVAAGALSAVSASANYGFTGNASAQGIGSDSWSFQTSVSTINQNTSSTSI